MKMNVYIDGDRVTRDFKQCVTLEHKEFIVSIAQGKELRFTEVIIFPAQGQVLVNALSESAIPAVEKNYNSVLEALQAIDSIHQLLDAGLFKWKEEE